MNENIQHEFFIWDEKNLIEHQKNCENKSVSETKDTTNDTQTKSMPIKWQNITNPKEREKAYQKVYNKAWRESNKDKIQIEKKTYYRKNKDKVKVQQKSWMSLNKEKKKLQSKSYYVLNKDKIKIQKKAYKEANKDKINSYIKNKKKTDIQYRLSCNLRVRLNSAINRNFKAGSAVRDLGCSISELKSYLESKFSSGMTWDNWALDGWHIDHIKPLSSFDLTNRQQLLEACHYTNLQPLWATDNLIKSDKII